MDGACLIGIGGIKRFFIYGDGTITIVLPVLNKLSTIGECDEGVIRVDLNFLSSLCIVIGANKLISRGGPVLHGEGVGGKFTLNCNIHFVVHFFDGRRSILYRCSSRNSKSSKLRCGSLF